MIALLASFLLATNAPACEVIENCRTMIPATVELRGRIILRNRRGIRQAEHSYVLGRTNGVTRLAIDGERYNPPADGSQTPEGGMLGTDVTWSDVTLDYLWWTDFSFDAEREGETVHGQVCTVIVMRNGDRTVRVWVDRKTGALMQAEEVRDGKSVRRLWGRRIKKFGERWMANEMDVETIGSGHRTKITVEEMR